MEKPQNERESTIRDHFWLAQDSSNVFTHPRPKAVFKEVLINASRKLRPCS